MLGEDSALFRRAELKALVNIHAEPEEDGALSVLTHDEVQVRREGVVGLCHGQLISARRMLAGIGGIPSLPGRGMIVSGSRSTHWAPPDLPQVIQGALDMATKTADTAMTPMSKVCSG